MGRLPSTASSQPVKTSAPVTATAPAATARMKVRRSTLASEVSTPEMLASSWEEGMKRSMASSDSRIARPRSRTTAWRSAPWASSA